MHSNLKIDIMKKFYTNPATEVAAALIADILDGLDVNPASAFGGEFDAPARLGGGDDIIFQ